MVSVLLRSRVVAVSAVVAAVLGTAAAANSSASSVRAGSNLGQPKSAALAPVRGIKVFVAGQNITVVWKNPKPAVGRVVVRYLQGAQAPSRSGGHSASAGTKHATSVTLRHLARDTQYTVAVWLRKGDSWSARRSTTFTTDAHQSIGTGTYEGKITDTAGNPLEGATVALDPFDGLGESDRANAVTDASGRYLLVLPAGSYIVDVDGSQATGGTADATGYVSGYDIAHIKAERTRHGPARHLRPGAAVSGQVIDQTGAPVAGATVYTAAPSPYVDEDDSDSGVIAIFDDGETAQATSGADGKYTLRGVAMAPQQICVDAGTELYLDYLGRCRPHVIDPKPGTSVEQSPSVLPKGHGGTVSGMVTSPSGVGLRGVLVDAFQVHGSHGGSVRTADDGSFQISGLADGNYRLCVDAALPNLTRRTGFQSGCPTKKIVVTDGQVIDDNVVLHRGGALTGTVIGANGRPLPGVEVNAGNYFAGTDTDASGQYRLNGLAGRRYRLCFDTSSASVHAGGTGSRSACLPGKVRARVAAVRTGLDIALKRGGAVSGVVLDANRAPMRDVDVSVENDRHFFFAEGQTAADGSFTVPNLKSTTYRVCFDLIDEFGPGREFCRDNVSVKAGKVTDDVDELLPAMSSVSVVVHDTSGHPVAAVDAAVLRPCSPGRFDECDRAWVFADSTPVKVVASEMTGGKGRVTIPHLKPGHYAVCLFAYDSVTPAGAPATGYADTCSSSTFDVVANPNSVVKVTVTLPDAGAITGRVTDAAGHPLRNVVVHVSGSAADDFDSRFGDLFGDGPAQYSRTDAHGRYTIRSVTPGDQTVCVDASAAKGGTSELGYSDQCIGGQPGELTGGTLVPIVVDETAAAPTLALTAATGISGTIKSIGKSRYIEVEVFDSAGKIIGEDYRKRPGSYSVRHLPVGTDRVCVMDNHDARCYVDVPWNGRKPAADATAVDTTAGVITKDIDIELTK